VSAGLPRVVATDCDGTLLRSDGTVSNRTRGVLAAVEEAGTTVILVTARPPRWMHELADVVGGHGIALCGNGAFTYDVAERRVVEHRLMDAQTVRELLEEVRAALPEVTFALESLEGFAREPEFRRVSGRRDGEWLVGTVAEMLAHPPGKILVRHPDWPVDELHRRVSEVVGSRGEVSHSGAAGLAEIGAAGVTKGLALTSWCEDHGVAADQVWAFGDMPNDLPMLAFAGRSFAVANAHPAVREAATDSCPANDDDGVATVLEEALGAG
jgi:Cof subfamily protein (haloacid dehalogenase superfamily)